jgi:DNA-binding transcriptional LysR family regulator
MSFTLTELQVLSGLAQHKKLATIGQELFLGQPSISKIIRSAEQRAGIPLVERQGHQLTLTPAGRELAEFAQNIVNQLRDMDRLLQDMRTAHGGPLRIVSAGLPANYILPGAISDFLQRFPDVKMLMQMVPSEQIWSKLQNEAFDIGICPQIVHPVGFILEPLFADRITFFVPAGSPLADRSELHWADLQGHPVVGSFGDPYWVPLFEELGRRGFTVSDRLDIRLPEAIKGVVERGYGVGVLVESALRDELASGRLCALPLAGSALSLPFFLIRRENAVLSPVARQFRSFLLDRFSEQATYNPAELLPRGDKDV